MTTMMTTIDYCRDLTVRQGMWPPQLLGAPYAELRHLVGPDSRALCGRAPWGRDQESHGTWLAGWRDPLPDGANCPECCVSFSATMRALREFPTSTPTRREDDIP